MFTTSVTNTVSTVIGNTIICLCVIKYKKTLYAGDKAIFDTCSGLLPAARITDGRT